VGSGSHAAQTAGVMKHIEKPLLECNPKTLLVYGDVNSTIAATLTAVKLGITVGHVEAGLRSFDRSMPEEINRILTDQISDLLFTHSPEANSNLENEGIPDEKIFFVGNVMIDTLVRLLHKAQKSNVLEKLNIEKNKPYILSTIHRPFNVDDKQRCSKILAELEKIGRDCTVICPAHPRTTAKLEEFGLEIDPNLIKLVEPVGYLDFLNLQEKAAAVVTDSGGIQEETTYLGVPCFTIRPNTERPVTVRQGTNQLINKNLTELAEMIKQTIENKTKTKHEPPELWDGKASERIAEELLSC